MKKIYMNPAIEVISVKVNTHILQTSGMETGDDWKSGEAGSREGKGFFDE